MATIATDRQGREWITVSDPRVPKLPGWKVAQRRLRMHEKEYGDDTSDAYVIVQQGKIVAVGGIGL